MIRAMVVGGLGLVLSLAAGSMVARGSDEFRVMSTSFKAGKQLSSARFVHDGAGCGGDNVSPGLSWSGAPAGTRSYAVTLFDPDARNGRGWWHWLVFDIPPTSEHLREGGPVPSGAVEGTSDFGVPGYQGPCPPPGSGAHHYVFTVYALDIGSLGLDPGVSGEQALETLRRHALSTARVEFLYGRP